MSFISSTASLIFEQPKKYQLGKLDIDIVKSIDITEEKKYTQNPVDTIFISDNAQRMPTKINFTGVISQYSIHNSFFTQLAASDTENDRLKSAHDELYRLYDENVKLSLDLKHKVYDNMYLTNLSMPKRPDDGISFTFILTFQEIIIVESQTTTLNNSLIKTDNAKKKENFGKDAGVEKELTPESPAFTSLTESFGYGF